MNRIDGRAKVTGKAYYAAEEQLPGLVHAVLVGSAIASGRITHIEAWLMPGVALVLTHENRGPLAEVKESDDGSLQGGLPLADASVRYAGQYVALVVAETLEQARFAASHLRIAYQQSPFALTIEKSTQEFVPDKNSSRGDVERALAQAPVRLDETYEIACEHPCAMEPHATLAHWADGMLTVRESSQWLAGDQHVLACVFELPREKVRVLAPYVGGGFGSKLYTGAHAVLTALAARRLGRPVRTALTREQVLSATGHRPRTVQRLELGASRDGRLTALRHSTTTQTSIDGDYVEAANSVSEMLYAVPNYAGTYQVKRIHTTLPSWMRAPGEAPGQFAQECALDELAAGLGLDPIELRRRNDTPRNRARCARAGCSSATASQQRRIPAICSARASRHASRVNGCSCALRPSI
jgi:xanthine dehydrogenase YagR molybdenum-binding subunit